MNILNKKISMEYKMYSAILKNKQSSYHLIQNYLALIGMFVGHLSSIEYDLLLEAMFKKYCMHDLDFEIEDCKLMVHRIRKFCDDIKDEFRQIQ